MVIFQCFVRLSSCLRYIHTCPHLFLPYSIVKNNTLKQECSSNLSTTYLKKKFNNVTYKVNVYWHKNWLGPWKKNFGSPAGPWRKNVSLSLHYIHSVLVQDFVSCQACCVNQYHYESLSKSCVATSS